MELYETVHPLEGQTSTQIKWLKKRLKEAAPPNALGGFVVVADNGYYGVHEIHIVDFDVLTCIVGSGR